MTDEKHLTEADAPFQQAAPLVDELRIESALVPNRRGELYGIAADRIQTLENALHRVIDSDGVGEAREIAVAAVGVSD